MENEVEFRDGWLLYVTAKGEQGREHAEATIARDLEVLQHNEAAAAPILVNMQQMGRMSAEARRIYGEATARDEFERIAFVTDSTFTRVAVNFFTRASGKADKTRFFSDDDEAIAWLGS